MRKSFFIFAFVLLAEFAFGWRAFVINFIPYYKNQPVELEKYYSLGINDSIRFNSLKFYISSMEFFQDGERTLINLNSYHLLDASSKTMQAVDTILPRLTFNKIKFNLGIDSITNNAGVMGGDLDPTNGMYWSWQSGYVNFKMEGSVKNNFSINRNKDSLMDTAPLGVSSNSAHAFEYHLGGFSFPNNACREIILPVNNNNSVDIIIDLDKFLNGFNMAEIPRIMSPGKDAMRLSSLLSGCFYVKP